MQFEFLSIDEKGPLGGGGLDGGEQNSVEMMEDSRNFEWLGTAESWVEETQVKRLMRWCKALRLSEVWVGDTGWHLENCAERALENALMDRKFVMANSPLSHRDCTSDTRKTVREEMGETVADCSRSAAFSPESSRITREISPEVLDVVSAILGDIEMQVPE